MKNGTLHDIRVIRYTRDGGYAAREWFSAFQTLEFPPMIEDGESFRIGIQITNKRAIDVILRIEAIDSVSRKIRATLKRTRSDALFHKPKACRSKVPETQRALALLSAKLNGRSIRILVCQPRNE